jgi:hypothetical protein
MPGSLYNEWRQCYFNNTRKSFEFANIGVNAQLGAPGAESEQIDIPNKGQPIFGIRLRLNAVMTTTGNAVGFATNIPARAFDIKIIRPDGKFLINLSANGGVSVHTAGWAVNDVIQPGDIRMYAEPFIGKAIDKNDHISGRLGLQTAGPLPVPCFDLLIPCFIPADSGTHKIQLRCNQFTFLAGVGGTIAVANPVNLTVCNFQLELIEECLPVGTNMSYFECTGPQTVGLVVGDNNIGNRLNRNKILKSLIIQSALPANMDQVDFLQNGNPIINTEFEDAVSGTIDQFPDMGIFDTGLNYGLDVYTVLPILRAPFKNVMIVEPGDLLVTDATELNILLNAAVQNIRIMQLTLATLTRRAVPEEVQGIQPAPASPVVAIGSGYPQRVEQAQNTNIAGTLKNAATQIFQTRRSR